MPAEYILTGDLVFIITVSINHGKPRQTRMSKTLLPIEFEMAIAPFPLRVTITPDITSLIVDQFYQCYINVIKFCLIRFRTWNTGPGC